MPVITRVRTDNKIMPSGPRDVSISPYELEFV